MSLPLPLDLTNSLGFLRGVLQSSSAKQSNWIVIFHSMCTHIILLKNL